ncbi:MAG: hypothetical protein V4691_00885 [Pseudomonadota bacterium]
MAIKGIGNNGGNNLPVNNQSLADKMNAAFQLAKAGEFPYQRKGEFPWQ